MSMITFSIPSQGVKTPHVAAIIEAALGGFAHVTTDAGDDVSNPGYEGDRVASVIGTEGRNITITQLERIGWITDVVHDTPSE